MPKRHCPFALSSPLQLKTHVNAFHVDKEKHMHDVYVRTQKLMMEGARRLKKKESEQKDDLEAIPKESLTCHSCLQSKTTVFVACDFCEVKTCSDCCRQCVSCTGIFCTLCSVINYDKRLEQSFCLGCSMH